MKELGKEVAIQYEEKAKEYFLGTRPEMVKFIPSEAKRILDIGCSGGGFGALLKEQRPDIEVWGIELHPEAAEIASERLDKVINSAFQDNIHELDSEKFDCIVFNDVLEHMVYPENALIVARNYLAEGGAVVASIPNILHFYNILEILKSQDWRYTDAGIMDKTHLRFFTKKSIERMFRQCGFSDLNIIGINESHGLKFSLVNFLSLGYINGMRYIQYAVIARI